MEITQRRTLAAAMLAGAGLLATWATIRAGRAARALAKADPDMRQVLEAAQALGIEPVETLSVAQARRQPTPADAVRALLRKEGDPGTPAPGIDARDLMIAGAAGPLPARVYTPRDAQGPLPIIVYWHGGGWVIADLDTYDGGARALARAAHAIVVSCHYRQAPEHKFPAAHEDANAAYRWVVENAVALGGDPSRIAVAGESAGGNLAANVALHARDAGIAAPVHQLLVYPVAGSDLDTPSYVENAQAMPLSKAGMKWFVRHVFRRKADAADPRIDLVNHPDLAGTAPATIIVAEIDPLRSDGERLAERLRAAGVPARLARFDGVTHEFFGMDAVVAKARAAQDTAGQALRDAFAAPAAGTARFGAPLTGHEAHQGL